MKRVFILIFCIFLVSIISATSVGVIDSDFTKGKVVYTSPIITFDNSTAYVNSSDRWITNERILTNVIDIEHNWLSNLEWSVSGHTFDTDLDITPYNFNASNITATEYFKGQPLDGSIGSGIINASSLEFHCACVNASDKGGLDVWYPDTEVKIWNFGENIYCKIPEDTYTVPDNAHTVYYVDSTCSIQTMTWTNYFAQDINPPNYARLFDVYAKGGDIGAVKGASVLGLQDRKNEFTNVNCGRSGHLRICEGMRISESDTFPEINLTSGYFSYINTMVTSQARNSNPDGLHVTCYSDGSHTVETEIDIDKCDNGASCDACPTDKYRRYIIYNIGWGTHTEIHQLAPLDDDTYSTLSNCLNIVKYPLSYTLPSIENGIAIPLAFYCGKRDDTAWRDGWVDIRAGANGFGADPDLSGFMIYEEWNSDANANGYSLYDLDWLEAVTLNITGNAYIGDLVWNGDLDLGGNNLFNANSTQTDYINSTSGGNITLQNNLDMDNYNITNAKYINEVDFTNITAIGDNVIWEIIF